MYDFRQDILVAADWRAAFLDLEESAGREQKHIVQCRKLVRLDNPVAGLADLQTEAGFTHIPVELFADAMLPLDRGTDELA